MKPSLRQLEAFVLAYRLGSLTKAADRMCLTQSAVSVLIRQLEAGLGHRLFDRTTRKLRPTTAAEEALPDAERVLNGVDHLAARVRGLGAKNHGHLRFAVNASLAPARMAPILKEFLAQYPNVKLTMCDVAPNQLVPRVIDEEVEFAIGTVDIDSREIVQETLVRDQLCAICLKDLPFARRARVTWDELPELTTISTPRGSGIRNLIDRALKSRNLGFNPDYEVSYLPTALSMSMHGLGLSIMPSHLLEYMQYPALVSVPLVGPVIKRNLSVIVKTGRSLSPAAVSFVDLARSKFVASKAESAVRR